MPAVALTYMGVFLPCSLGTNLKVSQGGWDQATCFIDGNRPHTLEEPGPQVTAAFSTE